MGGGSESSSDVKIDKKTMKNLRQISKQAMEISGLQQDFFKDFMLPYQQELMRINMELLPFISENAKLQLQIQNADLIGEAEIRDQLREAAKGDITKAVQLGDQLFAKIQEAADVEGRTTAKRSQIEQQYSRLERELAREGIDPTSPEGKAIQKELELEQTKASIQARSDAENEALMILSGGFSQFGKSAQMNVAGAQAGSLAQGNPFAQQFNVQSDAGMGALGVATNAANVASQQRTTTMHESGPGLGGILAGIGVGAVSAGVGHFGGGGFAQFLNN